MPGDRRSTDGQIGGWKRRRKSKSKCKCPPDTTVGGFGGRAVRGARAREPQGPVAPAGGRVERRSSNADHQNVLIKSV